MNDDHCEKKRREAERSLLMDPDFIDEVKAAYEMQDDDPEWLAILAAVREAEEGRPCLTDRMTPACRQAGNTCGA